MAYPLEWSNFNIWEQITFLRTWVFLYTFIVCSVWECWSGSVLNIQFLFCSQQNAITENYSWFISSDISHFGQLFVKCVVRNPGVPRRIFLGYQYCLWFVKWLCVKVTRPRASYTSTLKGAHINVNLVEQSTLRLSWSIYWKPGFRETEILRANSLHAKVFRTSRHKSGLFLVVKNDDGYNSVRFSSLLIMYRANSHKAS